MTVIRVSDTINKTKDAIAKFEQEIRVAKEEILRLEGCLLLLESYQNIGVEDIVPNHRENCDNDHHRENCDNDHHHENCDHDHHHGECENLDTVHEDHPQDEVNGESAQDMIRHLIQNM